VDAMNHLIRMMGGIIIARSAGRIQTCKTLSGRGITGQDEKGSHSRNNRSWELSAAGGLSHNQEMAAPWLELETTRTKPL